MSRVATPVAAGNWKMHVTPDEAGAFFRSFLALHSPREDRTVAFFPPALSFAAAREATAERRDILLGVQNVYWEEKGAFTGEISAEMAAAAGAALVLVGHSERRHVFGETDEDTRRKVQAVIRAGLAPLLCVGELLEERDSGRAAPVVRRQLEAVYDSLEPDHAARLLIAYEPVWAIGTGRTASPADAEEMHGQIRQFLQDTFDEELAARTPILYGGSVKPDNADGLLRARDVDGLLVGGASLQPDGFARICSAAG